MMKRKSLFLSIFVSCMFWGCQTENVKDASLSEDYVVSFVAKADSDDGPLPESKATMGVNPSGKLQTFWENGDAVSVYSSGNLASGSTTTKKYYGFETVLSSPKTSAVFGYKGTDFVEGDKYISIYPYKSSTREVNFGAKVISSSDSRMAYHMSQMEVPSSQTLVAGGFDRRAALAVAYSEDLETMNFKNAVALIKFKVADRNIVNGCIKAEGSKISGLFKACVLASGEHEPVLTDYSKTTSSQVDFSLADKSALSTETEYYVAVRPTEMQNGFSIWLNGTMVKKYDLEKIDRNVIYNLGTLSVPQTSDDGMWKSLTFDFSTDENLTGEWPLADKWKDSQGNLECIYDLDGVNYSFLCTDCTKAKTARTYWNSSNGCIVLSAAYRYLGLPVIEGYRLIKVTCLHGTAVNTTGRGLAVTSDITKSTVTPTYVDGGEPKVTKETMDYLSYDLEGTTAGTRYYLNCSQTGIGLSNITLVYEKAGATGGTAVRVGTYNLRVIANEDNEQNNWENRKDRVVQSIKDCNFDVFGVNECSKGIREYLETELASVYSGKYFNPYSATGIDDSSKVEYIGILYNNANFTLSDWHYFWQAADVASSAKKPSSQNDVKADGSGKYYRGGCCCILTHKSSDKKLFVMATHGCLDQESRELYAATYSGIEKKYNPNGYPSFFVGDMNARPASQTSEIYRKYWKDSYIELYPGRVSGPFTTFCGFNPDLDLETDPRRIDFIYYRGAEPFNYVCSDRMYDGYYPSDHLPVYVDMMLK